MVRNFLVLSISLFVLAACGGSGGGSESTPAPAGTEFVSADPNLPVPILDYSFAYADINVSGGPASIGNVVVKVNLTHTYNSDLILIVIAPDATSVLLSGNNGGSCVNYRNTVFDDSAATAITTPTCPGSGSSIYTGTFQPEGLLSGFNGKDANGIWQLEAEDDLNGDEGTIDGWSLILQ